MNVKSILASDRPTIEEISAHLDGLTLDGRVEEMFELDRAGQRRLFALAESSPPVDLDYFAPSDVGAAREVRHFGRNTLPLPRRYRLFEKRFCRPVDESERLFGYNESPFLGLIGPGYFVAVPTAGKPSWSERGAVVVDYFQVPDADARVPDGWPRIIPNTKGAQRFVFHGTRDFMRRVSDDVSIGAAYRGEKALGHYFVLVRERSSSGAGAS